MDIKFYTLWAINDELDERSLCQQLDQMRDWGFDGAVFHPRFYPGVPAYLGDEYLAILSRVILHAKSIGMEFWIYDENGWPSGTVGGELLRKFPDDEQLWADFTQTEPCSCDLITRFEHDSQTWYVARRRGAGVDYFSQNLAKHFIELTYEKYRTGLDPQAFDYVTAFFSDEPEFGLGHAYDSLSPHGAIPWTNELPELFRARYGQEITNVLPLLFAAGEGYQLARVRFWEFLTDLFCNSFVTPIDNWCKQHGKRFTLHVKGEEHPLFQVPMTGSCSQVYRHVAMPGIDALGRDPSGHFFPRQVVSSAMQFGDGDCMVECFGGVGWGASPADLENYLVWLAGHGLNHFVLHLFQSSLSTHAMQDWPASIPANVNWRDVFPTLLQRIREYASSINRRADTLIVSPHRGIMAEFEPHELSATNIHDASTYPDTIAGRRNREFLKLVDSVHESGANYHICDERTLDMFGEEDRERLRINNCTYSSVVMGKGTMPESNTRRLLSSLDIIRDVSTFSRSKVAHKHATPSVGHLVEVKWTLDPNIVNRLVLDVDRDTNGNFTASFESEVETVIQIVFADVVGKVILNGKVLGSDLVGCSALGLNRIEFHSAHSIPVPFASISGHFSVESRSGFEAGPNDTLKTSGPFVLKCAHKASTEDLIASGYPFCSDPLILNASFDLPHSLKTLQLITVSADCARISVDNIDRGWCWAPDWSITLDSYLGVSPHSIQVALIPSTFNIYGPHHHIDGDPRIVSPAQFEYVKNFADRDDSPLCTQVPFWHFKPLGLSNKIVLT